MKKKEEFRTYLYENLPSGKKENQGEHNEEFELVKFNKDLCVLCLSGLKFW